jgi:hypothetical protein
MKQCNHCLEFKPDEEFSWRYKSLGVRAPTCKACKAKFDSNYYESHSESHRQKTLMQKQLRRDNARDYIRNYLSSHPCVDCGERDPMLLEFDHVRGKKKVAVSQMVGQGYSIEAIQEEIDKCEVRCVSCHRKKTFDDRGWFKRER